MKDYLILAIIAAVIALVGVFTLGSKAPAPAVGAASGPDVFQHTFFHDNITVGGYDFATSSAGAVTYTAQSIVNTRVIEHIATGALTATLPTNAALSSAGFLPTVGDTQVLYIHASTTLITLAGNTGVTLNSASTTKQITPGNVGVIHFMRLGAAEGRGIWAFLSAD